MCDGKEGRGTEVTVRGESKVDRGFEKRRGRAEKTLE